MRRRLLNRRHTFASGRLGRLLAFPEDPDHGFRSRYGGWSASCVGRGVLTPGWLRGCFRSSLCLLLQAGSDPHHDAISLRGQEIRYSSIQLDEHARQRWILALLPDANRVHTILSYQNSARGHAVDDAWHVDRNPVAVGCGDLRRSNGGGGAHVDSHFSILP